MVEHLFFGAGFLGFLSIFISSSLEEGGLLTFISIHEQLHHRAVLWTVVNPMFSLYF